MLRHNKVFQNNRLLIVLLHITVEIVQELAVDLVEIFAHDDAHLVLLGGDNVDDLLVNLVPKQLRIAAKKRHVDFVVDVADFKKVGLFVVCDARLLLVFEFAGAVPFDGFQHLGVLADAGGAVEDHVFEFVDRRGELLQDFIQPGMHILSLVGKNILFKMGFMKLHDFLRYIRCILR